MPRLMHLLPALAVLTAVSGCSSEPAGVATGAAAATAAATKSQPASTPQSVAIISVSPDQFAVSGGHATWQVLEVAYTIRDPGKVTSAKVEVYARELGVIAREEAPIEASGKVRFTVDPKGSTDLGPTVRFRASCPEGTTDWHELGQAPLPYDQRTDDTLRISNVNPSSIREGPTDSEDSNQRGVGTRVSIYGKKLSKDCSIRLPGGRLVRPVEQPHVLQRPLRRLADAPGHQLPIGLAAVRRGEGQHSRTGPGPGRDQESAVFKITSPNALPNGRATEELIAIRR